MLANFYDLTSFEVDMLIVAIRIDSLVPSPFILTFSQGHKGTTKSKPLFLLSDKVLYRLYENQCAVRM